MIGGLILLFPVLTVILVFVTQSQRPEPSRDYMLEGVSFSSGRPVSGQRAVYPLSEWSPDTLKILEMGPVLLSADAVFDLAPPPADDSAETKEELKILHGYAEGLRASDSLKKIVFEESMTGPLISYEDAGLYFSQRNPESEQLISMALRDVGYFILRAKKQFARVRPDFLAPDLKTAIPNPGHPAYPSGHAGQAHMAGLVLSLLDEKHKDIYMAHAWAIGTRREIAGVHYPSDSVAGRKLAEDVLAKLMEVPEFQEQLKEAKASFVAPEESAFENYKPLIIDPALIVKPQTPEPTKQ